MVKLLTTIKNRISSMLLDQHRESIVKMFDGYFSKIIDYNNIPTISDNDKYLKWEKKWSVFGHSLNPKAYQVYSYYIGADENIVPNDIARNYIEPILTPPQLQEFYNDKNSLGQFLPKELLPLTLLRSMNGTLFDVDYRPVTSSSINSILENNDRVIVKPSMDMGGKGVQLFKKSGNTWKNNEGKELSLEYLNSEYGTDYLIQECINQCAFMSQFNTTSVNTIRLAMYRDVNNGEVHFLGAVLRMGGEGAVVDNICSGGRFVSIDQNGNIGNVLFDEYGRTATVHNGIDFSKNHFIVPDFDKIIRVGEYIASRMPHMYLFANDIIIDSNGNVKVIEVNTQWFSYWLIQFSSKAVFGHYTDDVIKYCKERMHSIRITTSLKRVYE